LAIHLGADVLAAEHHARLPPLYSCEETIACLAQLCVAVGVDEQHMFRGSEVTRERVNLVFDCAASHLDQDALLVVTFVGHSVRGDSAEDTRWCIFDDKLAFADITALFRRVPVSTRIVVVSDTCYAGALSRLGALPQTLILLAACGEDQWTMNRRRSEFVVRLTELICPGGIRNPDCSSYAWLGAELQKDVPDVERPAVWTNSDTAWSLRPL
jgi:hypothetical protein